LSLLLKNDSGRLLVSLVFEVSTSEPLTFFGAASVLGWGYFGALDLLDEFAYLVCERQCFEALE
jgi:hypothetical protein